MFPGLVVLDQKRTLHEAEIDVQMEDFMEASAPFFDAAYAQSGQREREDFDGDEYA